jgi:hypothetical protein
MSKGDWQRKAQVSMKEVDANWDRIFGKKKGTCGCGRSPTGDCIGWHSLSEEDFQNKLLEYNTSNK